MQKSVYFALFCIKEKRVFILKLLKSDLEKEIVITVV